MFSIEVNSLYTYGTPRVGNGAFHDFHAKVVPTSYRITHFADPVPHLPLLLMGFYHTDTEVFYQENNIQYKICTGAEDRSCANSVLLPFLVTDHLSYFNYDFVGNFLKCAF